MYTIFITNLNVSFHLRRMKNSAKYQRVSEYYDHDCSLREGIDKADKYIDKGEHYSKIQCLLVDGID